MDEKNCDLLFEYLKSILYDSKVRELDPEELDEPYRKLGYGLQYLQKAVGEMQAYSEELSQGNLAGHYPSRDNFLCSNLKNIHANLNHLSWQAKQVAAGDYSQHVSYLGDFSEAFNTMISQLKEREQLMKEEAEKEKQRAEVIESYNELFLELIQKRDEWILVVNTDTRKAMYCNRSDNLEMRCDNCGECLPFRDELVNWKNGENERIWGVEGEGGRIYRINTFSMIWQGCHAFAHVVKDITDEKQKTQILAAKAYHDYSTGLYNRWFFRKYMKDFLKEKKAAVFCYLDIDGLKYVNDHFGHLAGDEYIRRFVCAVQKQFPNTVMFARVGGDEFTLLVQEYRAAQVDEKLQKALRTLKISSKNEYPASFSYGLVEIRREEEYILDELIEQADRAMYRVKKRNKEKLKM